MTRLIDADALLEALSKVSDQGYKHHLNRQYVLDLIANAPTVQREGWVSVPIEPDFNMKQAVLDWNRKNNSGAFIKVAMEYHVAEQVYKAMIQAAPTDKE